VTATRQLHEVLVALADAERDWYRHPPTTHEEYVMRGHERDAVEIVLNRARAEVLALYPMPQE